jgi:hypothetical protein
MAQRKKAGDETATPKRSRGTRAVATPGATPPEGAAKKTRGKATAETEAAPKKAREPAAPKAQAEAAAAPKKAREPAAPKAQAATAAAPKKAREPAAPKAQAAAAAAPKKARKPAVAETAKEAAPVEAPLPEAPPAFRTPAPAVPPPLPTVTGVDHVAAVPLDPQHLFLYWELTTGGLARARAGLPDVELASRLILRLYVFGDGDGVAPEIRDEPVDDWLGRRRLRLERPGLRVAAAVGFRAGEVFVGVARSAPVHLPHPAPGTDAVRFVDLSGGRPTPAPTPVGVDGAVLRHRSRSPLPGAPVSSDLHVPEAGR